MYHETRIRAIRKALFLGRTLQINHPEIADDYQRMHIPQIIEKYSIQSTYSVGDEVARTAIRYALRGHRGGLDVPQYTGLLDHTTLDRLYLTHKAENGHASYRQGKGLYGRTPEQIREDNQEAGRALYEQRKGVHKLSREQRRKLGRNAYLRTGDTQTPQQHRDAGLQGIIAKGQTPWKHPRDVLSELECALMLSECYKRGNRANNERIAAKLNELYHHGEPVRTAHAVCSTLSIWKKKHRDDTTIFINIAR